MAFTVIVDHNTHKHIYNDNKPGVFKYRVPKSGKYLVCLKSLLFKKATDLPDYINICIEGVDQITYCTKGMVNAIKSIPLDIQKKQQSFTFDMSDEYHLNLSNSDTLEISITDEKGHVYELNAILCINFTCSDI